MHHGTRRRWRRGLRMLFALAAVMAICGAWMPSASSYAASGVCLDGTSGLELTNNGATTCLVDGAAGTYAAPVNLVGAAVLTAHGGGTYTMTGLVSGGGSLTFTGSGTVTLTATNTYSGATIVTGGVLKISPSVIFINTVNGWATSGFSVSGGTLVVQSAGRLDLTGGARPKTISLVDGTVDFTGSPVGGGIPLFGNLTFDLTGENNRITSTSSIGVNLNSSSVLFTGSGNAEVSTKFWNNGSLLMNGSGRIAMAGANDYGGTTTINSGSVRCATSTCFGTGTTTVASGAVIEADSAAASTSGALAFGSGSTLNVYADGSAATRLSSASTGSAGAGLTVAVRQDLTVGQYVVLHTSAFTGTASLGDVAAVESGAPSLAVGAQDVVLTISPVISYESNGADSGTPTESSQIVEYGGTVTTAASGTLSRNGYSFTGWNTVADGSGTAIAASSQYTPAVSQVLYAQWVESQPPTIAVTRAPDQAVYINQMPLRFLLTLSEAAAPGTLTAADIDLGADQGELSEFTAIDDFHYEFTVTGTTAGQRVLPAVAAGSFTDLVGNSNLASDNTPDQNWVMYDTVAPTVSTNKITTTTTSPALSGYVNDLDAVVTVTIDGHTYPAVTGAEGTWYLAAGVINPALLPGRYAVRATATDLAGNSANVQTTRAVTIQQVADDTDDDADDANDDADADDDANDDTDDDANNVTGGEADGTDGQAADAQTSADAAAPGVSRGGKLPVLDLFSGRSDCVGCESADGSTGAGGTQTHDSDVGARVDDLDDVASEIEDGAPNDGDGNDDGLRDSEQSQVVSLSNPVTGGYTTFWVRHDAGTQMNQTVPAERVLSFAVVDPHTFATVPASVFPVGMIDYVLVCAQPGDTVEVEWILDKVYDTSKWELRTYDPDTAQYGSGPDSSYEVRSVGGASRTVISYEITDGGPFDRDGVRNGEIVDPMGPQIMPDVQSSLNWLWWLVLLLPLVYPAWWWWRRYLRANSASSQSL